MVSQNRIKHQFEKATSELCCNCSQPLGDRGVYYWGRVRVCNLCHRENLEWELESAREQWDKERLLMCYGWAAVLLSGSVIVGMVAGTIFK